jgi:hypothetical protein
VSNTPLQALVLLNDPQFVEAYRALATHVLKTEADSAAQVALTFRLATRRQPREDEQHMLQEFLAEQLALYRADLVAARALAAIGVTPPDATVDRVQLAAFTNLVAVIMNSPDAYTLR